MNRQAAAQPAVKAAPGGILQRKCACGKHAAQGECEDCKKKKQTLRRKAAPGVGPAEVPPVVHEVLRSPGQPLDPATRTFMEPRFGHDFSQVRVHRDGRAAESARAVSALAYTVGKSVVFADGQYQPATAAGRRLLAHELTHVVQQAGSAKRGASLEIGPVNDMHEQEADRFADAVFGARSPAPAVSTGTPGPLAAARLQRAGDGKCHTGYEAGAVGSVEFCVDFCKGDWRAIGWVWVGAGYRTALGCTFVGPSAMYEGTLASGNLDSFALFDCGECADQCEESEGWSGGIAGFPNLFSPSKDRQTLSLAGLECGVLFIPSSLCRATLEGICFLDLIQYLGPAGKAISKIAEKLKVEVKAGIDGGVTLEVCKGKGGGIVIPKGEVCLGGFIEVGKGLSRNKEDHQ